MLVISTSALAPHTALPPSFFPHDILPANPFISPPRPRVYREPIAVSSATFARDGCLLALFFFFFFFFFFAFRPCCRALPRRGCRPCCRPYRYRRCRCRCRCRCRPLPGASGRQEPSAWLSRGGGIETRRQHQPHLQQHHQACEEKEENEEVRQERPFAPPRHSAPPSRCMPGRLHVCK